LRYDVLPPLKDHLRLDAEGISENQATYAVPMLSCGNLPTKGAEVGNTDHPDQGRVLSCIAGVDLRRLISALALHGAWVNANLASLTGSHNDQGLGTVEAVRLLLITQGHGGQ
jgi:hypothetical protein